MTQADLFADAMMEGLAYRSEFISAAEEATLIDRLQSLDLAPFRFHGWTGNRKTQSFGWRYDFDDASFSPAEPIPDWLGPLRDEAAALAEVVPSDIAHALLARYDPGAASAGTRTGASSIVSSASPSARPRPCASASEPRTDSAASPSRSSRAPPTSCRVKPDTSGSIGSFRATGFASRSRFEPCPIPAAVRRPSFSVVRSRPGTPQASEPPSARSDR